MARLASPHADLSATATIRATRYAHAATLLAELMAFVATDLGELMGAAVARATPSAPDGGPPPARHVDATPGARVGRGVTASTADDGRSLRDAARILGISPHTVRVLARQRRIAHYRMGRRLVFKATDLAAYLATHRVQARLSAELQ